MVKKASQWYHPVSCSSCRGSIDPFRLLPLCTWSISHTCGSLSSFLPPGPPSGLPASSPTASLISFPPASCALLGQFFQNPHALYQSHSPCCFLLPFSKNTLFCLTPVGSRPSKWLDCGVLTARSEECDCMPRGLEQHHHMICQT